jgi:hypothetical protein
MCFKFVKFKASFLCVTSVRFKLQTADFCVRPQWGNKGGINERVELTQSGGAGQRVFCVCPRGALSGHLREETHRREHTCTTAVAAATSTIPEHILEQSAQGQRRAAMKHILCRRNESRKRVIVHT